RPSGGAGVPRALLTSLEDHLVSLPGVTLARVEVRPTGEIVGIHLMVSAGVETGALTTAVEETLRTTFDLRIAPEQIFVAQVNARTGATSGRPGSEESLPSLDPQRSGDLRSELAEDHPRLPRRVYFEDLEVRRSRVSGITCRVSLRKGALVLSGEVTGASTERSRADLAARATLAALGAADVAAQTAAIDHVLLIDALERRYVVVAVAARRGREIVPLTGVCEVREDVETAAVLATLSATNRWLARQ
ncbi:MAG: hypothetical protein M3O91_10745, partial [Chloroflexota bacterium]|nr:hypothetical protein [Chloroflexota bacterium]